MIVMHGRMLLWSLRQRRWRHVLNALAITVTAGVVIAFVSMMLAVMQYTKSSSEGQLELLMLAPKVESPMAPFADGFPMTLKANLEKIDGVKVVQRRFVMVGKTENSDVYLIGGEEDSGLELNRYVYGVDDAGIAEWKKKKPHGAVVSEATAAQLNLKVGDTTEVPTFAGKALKIEVVAIGKGGIFPNVIGTHFEYLHEFAKGQACGYRVFIEPASFEKVSTEITALTKNSPTPAKAVSSDRLRADQARKSSTIPAVLGFLGLFLVLTTALTLANNSAIAIRERRIEVATLRVLGYYSRTIRRILVTEAVLVGLIGGLLASAIMLLVFDGGFGFAAPPVPGQSLSAPLSKLAIGAGLLVSVLIPLLGALPSAIAATRRPLVEGLRESA
jgi:ABC-type lipoprotein release transport system permease subunit